MPPRGMDHKEFQNRIYVATSKALEEGKARSRQPYWCDFKILGSGRYEVFYLSGERALDNKGKQIVVNVHSVTMDELKGANKTMGSSISNLWG